MELKNGYKQTEIGVIPSDWEVKLLCQLGENIIGLTYSPNNVSEYGHLVLRSSNIQDNKLAFKNNVFVDMDLPNRVIVKENDILICVRNGSKQLIGKCALIDKQTEGSAFGAFMSVYRTEYSSYIFHQFQSNIIHKQIEEVMGATINQLTNKDLATFQIPFPPTKLEQNAISTSLSDADALIYNFEKLIEKKKNIKQGVIHRLLKPQKDWVVKKVQDIAVIGRGRVISHKEIALSLQNTYPVYSSQTTNDGIMGFIDKYDFDGEYITWTTDGENAGTVFYRDGKFNCTNVCGTIKLKSENARFISYLLNSVTPLYVSKNLANPKLMNDVMKKIEIAIPDIK